MVWDDANRQVIACPSAPQANLAGVRSSDGSKVLFVTPQSCCQYLGSGPLSLLTLGNGQGNAGSCTLLARLQRGDRGLLAGRERHVLADPADDGRDRSSGSPPATGAART